jgi:1,4-alpha-glucan branching enzyme
MTGDEWQQRANLRALLAFMWAHPGKQLLFMGGEIGQRREWSHDSSIDWDLLTDPGHRGIQRLVADANRAYRAAPALWQRDTEPEGFTWIDANDADGNVLSFFRTGDDPDHHLVCICNLAPVVRHGFRVGLPTPGRYAEVLNTDAEVYGGSNVGNLGAVTSEPVPWHGLEHSAEVTLPPLAVLWLRD